MTIKPRHGYEVTDTSVTPADDRLSATVLIDTAGPIDLLLHASRDTLARLRIQIDAALSTQVP